MAILGSITDLVKSTLTEIGNYLSVNQKNLEVEKTRAIEYVKSWITQLYSGDAKPLDTILLNPTSIGYFYLIGYNSLLYERKQLPHYDSVPLMMILGMYKKVSPEGYNLLYWVGLNFHWIEPRFRAMIIKKLIQYNPQAFFNERRVDGMSYAKLRTIIGENLLKHCKYAIRCYRYDRLQSMGQGTRILRIKNSDIVSVLAFNPIIPIGTTKKESYKIIASHNNKTL